MRAMRLTTGALLFLTIASACSRGKEVTFRGHPTANKRDSSWSEPTDCPPSFFYADDIEAKVRESLEQAFAAAIAEWGNYGPIEYWVVGRDVPSAERLATRYCQRRSNLDNESLEDCKKWGDQRSKWSEWAERAAEIERTGQPFLAAGHNGGAQWGLHIFYSSYPPGWAGIAGVSIEDDQTVLFHEYFHAIQVAHVLSLDDHDQLMGPVWWIEGGAEFMAQAACAKLRSSGSLPRDSRNLGLVRNLKKEMQSKLQRGLAALAERPDLGIADVKYGPDAQIAYDLGCWAVAYLCNKAGPHALLEEFYPNLDRMGWEGAFRQTFNMTSDEFHVEFDQFLALPFEKQMEILP